MPLKKIYKIGVMEVFLSFHNDFFLLLLLCQLGKFGI
jgi:hypothetical protein